MVHDVYDVFHPVMNGLGCVCPRWLCVSFRAQAGTGTSMEWGLYVPLRSSNSLRVLTERKRQTQINYYNKIILKMP